jgi:hypothetical protein
LANTFKSVTYTTTTTIANAYVCPAATTAIIIGAQAANLTTSTVVGFSARISNGAATSTLVANVAIPGSSALGFISGKLVLEAGEYLQANATSASNVNLTLSILEIT